ncbi:MAG: alpha-glucan family phosphorylase [Bifidobacteriaceae bacterium]|jgi:starch phosphorylase|nr:alpha-glucan family phosphorylase [Bifidobacteriaceae bacterium]
MRLIRRFTVRTVLPPAIEALDALATNLRWSWHAPTRDLFESIAPEVWSEVRGDPVALLGALEPERLRELAEDGAFVERVRAAAGDLARYLDEPRWYQGLGPRAPRSIAYFSPEFGITAVLPQYSGGLGILAGDHLKSASDLGVPIVGVGLFYQAGYFKQSLTRDGWQAETYPLLDPDGLPLSLLREADGAPTTVCLARPDGGQLGAWVWRAQVGRVPLLLLDSDIPANDDAARSVTDRLYGGGGEHRLLQELLLGMGGVKALRAYSRITGAPAPEVFHTNEGHAGFLGVERIKELVGQGLSFAEGVEAVRGSTVFTTHTPVPAGIDRFEAALVAKYFPGPEQAEVLALGAETYAGGDPAVFNMAVMGLRLAGRANGVSVLHGQVSRAMFQGLWPGFDQDEVPIGSVTNGVHSPTWLDRAYLELESLRISEGPEAQGSEGWLDPDLVSDETLWGLRRQSRARLVADARRRLRASYLARGSSPAELGWIDQVLSPDVLTIGFARRVPTYKRLTLMLRDPERLRALLVEADHPVQIVIAGKSHPADEQGKSLIQELVRFSDDPAVRGKIVFLPNYDMDMAETLFPGCDVWLNNPLRPLEACGTSGMKAAINGALNLSILDGWWDEWFDGQNGWAIPTADGVSEPGRRDNIEAQALYDLIQFQVAPRFYARDGRGLPVTWLEMVRHTLATLAPKVQATRMVAEYVSRLYAPAADLGRRLDAGAWQGAKALAAWKAKVRAAWPQVRVDHVESGGVGDVAHVGDVVTVTAYVSLGALSPADVDVQVVYGRATEGDDLRPGYKADSLAPLAPPDAARQAFSGDIQLGRSGAFGYTVRIVPKHPLLVTAADLGLIATA